MRGNQGAAINAVAITAQHGTTFVNCGVTRCSRTQDHVGYHDASTVSMTSTPLDLRETAGLSGAVQLTELIKTHLKRGIW